MQYVYVLNKLGEPLMACSPGKARLLLKQQKACVVKRTPFTIKLLFGSAGYKQPITLGVDAGSKHVGLSASTEKRELYSEEFTPRSDVVKLLSTDLTIFCRYQILSASSWSTFLSCLPLLYSFFLLLKGQVLFRQNQALLFLFRL